jgi:hypothetical protein
MGALASLLVGRNIAINHKGKAAKILAQALWQEAETGAGDQ